jgi:uncharacterized protein YndB with AHSA1/START domain
VATNSAFIDTTRQRVFAALSDGWCYSNWVVGTSHMRAVESAWPAVGSRLFHASGAWPFVTRDETRVEECEPERRLVLRASGGPAGDARIVLDLADEGDGCRVTMHETPVSGLGNWLHNPLSEAVLLRRNIEALARLAAVAERRTAPSE